VTITTITMTDMTSDNGDIDTKHDNKTKTMEINNNYTGVCKKNRPFCCCLLLKNQWNYNNKQY
jgi:hypothetical protein